MKIATIFTIPLFWGIVAASPPFRESNEKVGDLSNLNYREQHKEKIPDLGRIVLNEDKADDYAKAKIWKRSLFEILKKDSILNKKGDEDKKDHGLVLNGLKLGKKIVHRAIEALSKLVGNGNLDKRSLKSEELDKLTDIVPGNEPHDVKKRENIKLLNVREKNAAEDANGKKNKLEKSLKESSGPGSREKIQAKKEEIFNSIPTITVHKEQKKLESGNKKKDDDSTVEKEQRSSSESLLNVQRNKRGTSTSLWNFYDKDSQEVNDLVTRSHVNAVLKNRYASVAEAMNSGVAIERILQQANENVAKVQDLDDDFPLEKFNNEFNKWLANSLEDSFNHLEHFDHHLPTYIKVQQKQARHTDYKNPYRTRAESSSNTQARASGQDVPYVKPRSYENSDFPWQYNENSRYDNKRSSDDTRSIWQSPSDKKDNKYDNRLYDSLVPQVSRENPYGTGENVKNNVPWEDNRDIKQDNRDTLDWGYPNRYGERNENSAATAVASSSANSGTTVDDIYKNTYIPSSWFVDDKVGNNNDDKMREEARKSWNNIDYATATLAPPLAANNARNNANNYEKFLPSHWLVDETVDDNDHHVVPHNQPMVSNVPIIADERRKYDSFSPVNNVESAVQARTIATAKATPAKERNDKETNRPIDFLKSTLAIEGIKSPSVTKLASVPDEWLVDEEALKQNSRSNAIVAVKNFAGVPLADRNKYGLPAFGVNDEIINTEDDARSSASAGAGANTSAGTSAGASVGVLHQGQDTNTERSVNKANSDSYAPALNSRDFAIANDRPGEFNGEKYNSVPWSVNDKPLQNVPPNWLAKQPVASNKPNNGYKVPSITLGSGKEDQENYKPLTFTKPVVVPVNEQELRNVPHEIANGKVHTISNVKPDIKESPTGQYSSDESRNTEQDTRENKNELPQESISPLTPALGIANHQKNIPNHWLPEKVKGKEYDVSQWQNKNPVASGAPVNTFDGLAGPLNVANADVSSFSPINHEQFALGKKERIVNDENTELPIAKTNVKVLPQANAVDEGKQRPHPLNLEPSDVQESTIADILQTAKDTTAETLKQDNEEVRPRIVDDKTVWADADSDAAAFGSASTGVTEGSSTINQERKNLEWSSEDESPKGDKKSALFANANAGGDGAAKADVSTSDNNESNDKEIVTGHSVADVVEDKNAENRNNAVTVAEANTNTIAAANDKYENNGKSESTTQSSEDDILRNENDSNAKVLASISNDSNDQVDDNGEANDEVRETPVNNENDETSINVLEDKVKINKNNAIIQPLTSVVFDTDSPAEQLEKEDQNPKEKDTNYSDIKLPVTAANVDAIRESSAKPTDHWEAKPLNKDLENDNKEENNGASAKSSALASASSNNQVNENIENQDNGVPVAVAHPEENRHTSVPTQSGGEKDLSQEREENNSSLENVQTDDESSSSALASAETKIVNPADKGYKQLQADSKKNENEEQVISVAEANAATGSEASDFSESNEEQELSQEHPENNSSLENHNTGAESLATASASANAEVDNNNENLQKQSENDSKPKENKESTVAAAEANATAESQASNSVQSNEDKELSQERPESHSSPENHDAGAESLATASASSNAEIDNNNENHQKQSENDSRQKQNKENTLSVAEANAIAESQASNSVQSNEEKELSQERPESDSSLEKHDAGAESLATASASSNAEVDNHNENQHKQLENDSKQKENEENTVAVAEANVEVETKASDLSTSNAEENVSRERPEDKNTWERNDINAESSSSASSSANVQIATHSENQEEQLEEKSKEMENKGNTVAVAETSTEADSHASNWSESSEEQELLQEHTENNSSLENVVAGAESSASVSTNAETQVNNRVVNEHKQVERDSKENRNEENAISVAEASAEAGSQGTDSSERSEEQEISQEQVEKNSSLEKHGAAVESNASASASADTQVEDYSEDHHKQLENDSKEKENKHNTVSVAEANAKAVSQASDYSKNSGKQDLLHEQPENDSLLEKHNTDESSATASATADAEVDTSVTNEHKQSEAVSKGNKNEENTTSADETNAEAASKVSDSSKSSEEQELSQEQPNNNLSLRKNDAGTESSATASANAVAEVDTSVTNEHKQLEVVSEGNRNEENTKSADETNAATENQSNNSSESNEEQELPQQGPENNLSVENVDAGAESSASASASANAEVETSIEEKDNQLEGHSEGKRNEGNALSVAEANAEAESRESNSSESQESYSFESQESNSSESQESNSSESSEEQELPQEQIENNSSSENHDAAAESNASTSASAETQVENYSENNEKKLEYNSKEQESEVKTVSVAEVNAADASETKDSSAGSTEGELQQGLTEDRNNWDKNNASAASSALASSSATSQAANHSENQNQQEQVEDNSQGKENRENTVAVAEANAEAQSQASGSLETSEKEEQSQRQQEEQNSWDKNDASAESSASASASVGTNVASQVENEQNQWGRESKEKGKEEIVVSMAQANAEAESQASESPASGGKEELRHERPENKITWDKSDANGKSSAFTSTSADAHVATRTEDRHKQLEGDYKGIENGEKAVSAAETHADAESQANESSVSSGEKELHHERVENEVTWDKSDASVESSSSASTSASAQVIDHSEKQQEQIEEYSKERDTSEDTVAVAEANVEAESQTNDSAGSNEERELRQERPDNNLSSKLHSAGAESAATASSNADAQSVDHNENHQKQLENLFEKKENHESAVSVAEANAKAESQASDLTAGNVEKELPQQRPEDKNTWDSDDNVVESSASASSSANSKVTNHSENQEQLEDNSKERVNGNTVTVAEVNAEGESQSNHSSENNEVQDLIQERPENNSPLVIHNVGAESTATATANSDAQSINHSESNQKHLESGSENKENEESTISVAEVNTEAESKANDSSDSSTEGEILLGRPEDENTLDRNHASEESSVTASSNANVKVADHSDNQEEQLEDISKERENSLHTVAVAEANAEAKSQASDSTETNGGKDLVLESQKYHSHLEKHDITAESFSSTTAHSDTHNVNHKENHQKELESVSKKEENEEKAVSTAEANAFADSQASDLSTRGGEDVLSQEHSDYKSLLEKDVLAETSTSESASLHTQVSSHSEGQVVQQEKDTEEKKSVDSEVSITEVHTEATSASSLTGEEGNQSQARSKDSTFSDNNSFTAESSASASATADSSVKNHNDDQREQFKDGWSDEKNVDKVVSAAEANSEVNSQASGSPSSSREREVSPKLPEDNNTWDKNDASVASSASSSVSAESQVNNHSEDLHNQLEGYSDEKGNVDSAVLIDEANAGSNSEANGQTSGSYLNREDNNGEENRELPQDSLGDVTSSGNNDVGAESLAAVSVGADSQVNSHSENEYKTVESVSKERENVNNAALVTEVNAETDKAPKYDDIVIQESEASGYGSSNVNDISPNERRDELAKEDSSVAISNVKSAVNVDDSADVVVASTTSTESVPNDKASDQYKTSGSLLEQNNEKDNVNVEVNVKDVTDAGFTSLDKDNIDSSTILDTNDSSAHSSGLGSTSTNSEVQTGVNDNYKQSEQNSGKEEENIVNEVVSTAEANSSSTTKSESDTNYEAIDNASQVTVTDKESRSALLPVKDSITEEHENIQSDWKLDTHGVLNNQDIASSVTSSSNEVDSKASSVTSETQNSSGWKLEDGIQDNKDSVHTETSSSESANAESHSVTEVKESKSEQITEHEYNQNRDDSTVVSEKSVSAATEASTSAIAESGAYSSSEAKDDAPLLNKKSNEVSSKEESGFSEWTTPAGDAPHSESKILTLADADAKIAPVSVYEYIHSKTKPDDKEAEWRKSVETDSARFDETDSGKLVDENNHAEVKEDNNSITDFEVISPPEVIASSNIESDFTSTSKDEVDEQNKEELDSVNTANDLLTNDGTTGNIENGGPRVSSEKEQEERDTNADVSTDTKVDNVQNISDDHKEDGWLIKWKLNDHSLPMTAINENGAREISQKVGPIIPSTATSDVPEGKVSKEEIEKSEADLIVMRKQYGRRKPISITYMKNSIAPMVVYRVIPKSVYEQVRNLIKQGAIVHTAYGQARTPKT